MRDDVVRIVAARAVVAERADAASPGSHFDACMRDELAALASSAPRTASSAFVVERLGDAGVVGRP